jgi:hypothetical protein
MGAALIHDYVNAETDGECGETGDQQSACHGAAAESHWRGTRSDSRGGLNLVGVC